MREDGGMPSGVPDDEPSRVFAHGDFDAAALAVTRGDRTVSVCIPARDEAATIGAIVSCITSELTSAGGGVPLVDEVLVVDDGSTDGTGALAAAAGARVIGGDSPSGG